MADYHAFEGRVVPMEWGDATYTILPIPPDLARALAQDGARRVEGEINDHPFNLAVTKAPVWDGPFLYAGKAALADWDVTPGEPVKVRLRKADPDQVETPSDVALALRDGDLTQRWDALSPGRRRGLLHTVTSAKRVDTRKRRIAALLKEIAR